MDRTRPLHPDRPAPQTRRTRQPLVAAALSAVLPGAGQLYAGRTRRAVPYLVVSCAILLAAAVLLLRDPLTAVKLAFRPGVLLGFLALDLALLAFRLFSALDAYWVTTSTQPTSRATSVVGAGAIGLVLLVPHLVFAYYDLVQYDLITTVFAGPTTTTTTAPSTTTPPSDTSSTTVPGTQGTATSNPATTTTAPSTTTTTAPRSPWDGYERVNILLLGGDAGVGRVSVRTDTMILVSLDPATGDVALFSIPRNFAEVPLPASVGIWECNCFPRILNELYRYGEEHPDGFPGPATPGANAIKGAVGELLGLRVDFYALVVLEGFVDIVDALGGVTVTVGERVYDPAYPKEEGGTEVIDIQPGTYDFDGHMALAFARSRYSSDDYDRMGRQRCVIEAMVREADPLSLLRGFPRIAQVLKDNLQTDIPLDSIPDLIDIAAKVDTELAVSLRFVPPTYVGGVNADGYNTPNVALIRDHVRIATTLPPLEAMAALGIDPLADACS